MAVIVEVFLLSSSFCVGLLEIRFLNWSSFTLPFYSKFGKLDSEVQAMTATCLRHLELKFKMRQQQRDAKLNHL